MSEQDLRRAHFHLWRAWRGCAGNLSEASAWDALLAAGFEPDAIVEALRELDRRGDIATRYNRDIPWFGMLRDDLGFAAQKGGWRL